jgi:hypothetical protein
MFENCQHQTRQMEQDGFGETSWLDAAVSVGQSAANKLADKRRKENEARAAASAASAQQMQTMQAGGARPAPESHMLLYIGLGVGVLAITAGAFYMLKK